jgi:predicted nuclease of predicted toxin-antitoxin system
MFSFLIDECLATDLVKIAHGADHAAYHVAYIGMAGRTDHAVAKKAVDDGLIIVTLNARDFRGKHPPKVGGALGAVELHPGLICLNVQGLAQQCEAFRSALQYLASLDSMINVVVEVDIDGQGKFVIKHYVMPPI